MLDSWCTIVVHLETSQRDEQNFTKHFFQAWNCWKTRKFLSLTHFGWRARCFGKVPNMADNLWGSLGMVKRDVMVHCKKETLLKLPSRAENNMWWAIDGSWEAVLPDEKLTNSDKAHPMFSPNLKNYFRTSCEGGRGGGMNYYGWCTHSTVFEPCSQRTRHRSSKLRCDRWADFSFPRLNFLWRMPHTFNDSVCLFFFLSLKLTSEGKRCCERGCGRKWWAILWQRYRGISMSSRNTDETDFLKNTNAISQHHLSAAFTNAATARPPPRYAFWLLEHRRSQMARGTQRQLHFPPTRDNMMTITAHSPDTMDDVTTALGSRKITKPLENT